MNQMSAHSAAQELGSDGKAMCFSNNSGDSNGVNIGVNEPAGSCYMGALRINSNYGFESGWDEPSAEVRNTLGLTDTLNKILGKHSITAGIDLMHQHAVENTAYPTQPLIGFGRNGTAGTISSYTGILSRMLPSQLFPMGRIPGRLYVGRRHRGTCRAPARSPMWPAGSLVPSSRTTGRFFPT